MLPHDFPVWQTVYGYFRHWRITKTWQDINAQLQQWYRVSEAREATPSAGCIVCFTLNYFKTWSSHSFTS